MKTEWIEFSFNNSIISHSQTKQILLIKFIFLITSIPVYSQSLFESPLTPFLLDIENADDIQPFNIDSSELYVYTQVPDLSQLSVHDRKKKFIDLILPSILIEKSKIKTAYNYVLDNFDNIYPNNLTQSLYDYCNCITADELLLCLSEQPTSIIIAQAAIESGWGSSRFFVEGFNLFGIHSYKSDEPKIKATGSLDSDIYVKKYDSISSSIFDYLRTLAKGYAYNNFRKIRAEEVDVTDMIKYLDRYSERRELYINDLKLIIEYNHLMYYDTLEFYLK